MLIAVSLVIAGGVSAALVSYISNATTSTVAVSSPVAMTIYDGDYNAENTGNTEPLILTSTGASDFTFTTIATNNANNRIGGYYVMVIEATGADDKMTGDEFIKMIWKETPWVNLRDDLNATGSDIINELCVVGSGGALKKLSVWANDNSDGNKKLVIFWDSDGNSSNKYCYGATGADESACGTAGGEWRVESTGMCSTLTPYLETDLGQTETRSVTHLNAGSSGLNPRSWTFTPTWDTNVSGNFSISSQYVYDLAKFATEQGAI